MLCDSTLCTSGGGGGGGGEEVHIVGHYHVPNIMLVAFQGPNNERFSGPTPEYAPSNVFPPIQNISHGAAEIIEA